MAGRLLARAFKHIFSAKQTRYSAMLAWLDGQLLAAAPQNAAEALKLRSVVRKGEKVFRGK